MSVTERTYLVIDADGNLIRTTVREGAWVGSTERTQIETREETQRGSEEENQP